MRIMFPHDHRNPSCFFNIRTRVNLLWYKILVGTYHFRIYLLSLGSVPNYWYADPPYPPPPRSCHLDMKDAQWAKKNYGRKISHCVWAPRASKRGLLGDQKCNIFQKWPNFHGRLELIWRSFFTWMISFVRFLVLRYDRFCIFFEEFLKNIYFMAGGLGSPHALTHFYPPLRFRN